MGFSMFQTVHLSNFWWLEVPLWLWKPPKPPCLYRKIVGKPSSPVPSRTPICQRPSVSQCDARNSIRRCLGRAELEETSQQWNSLAKPGKATYHSNLVSLGSVKVCHDLPQWNMVFQYSSKFPVNCITSSHTNVIHRPPQKHHQRLINHWSASHLLSQFQAPHIY